MSARASTSRRRPVLVTGSNRSGTTWVGHMLCASGELSYVHEPFNPGIWPRWMADPLPARDVYVCEDNQDRYVPGVEGVLQGRFPISPQLRDIRSVRDVARLSRDAVRYRLLRRARPPILVKDPIALFSAEWLATRFAMDVVVMVRNPAAYASSIKRLGWKFDFDNWLRQDLLLRDHLGPYVDDIRRAAASPPDAIGQAVLRWNAMYHYVDRARARHPEWHVVLHEELASDPESGFEELYAALGLVYDEGARLAVRSHSDATNVKEVRPDDKGGIRRDSRASVETWRTRLTAEEVERVTAGTAEVAARFYDATAWAS